MAYKIGGIQQVGIGVSNAAEANEFYKKNFGMSVKVFDDAAEAKFMTKYTGGEVHSRRAILSLHSQGGGGFEIWQFTSRTPADAKRFDIGDIGILAIGLGTLNDFSNLEIEFEGDKETWFRDPYGNLFHSPKENNAAGVKRVFVGVKNLNQAEKMYSQLLKANRKEEGVLNYKGESYPTLTLGTDKPDPTAFSKILGGFEIVLVESPQGENYFEGRYWGDKGFIHLCFDVENMDDLKSHMELAGYGFTVDSQTNFDMGDAGGRFAYVEDPDGTLIELVEVMKFPISKKPKINIPLTWKILKPLPKSLLKVLG